MKEVFSFVSPIHWRTLARVTRDFAPDFWCVPEGCCKHAKFYGFCALKLLRDGECGNDGCEIYPELSDKEFSRMRVFYMNQYCDIKMHPNSVYKGFFLYSVSSPWRNRPGGVETLENVLPLMRKYLK
jgi:hypothetical protein